MKRMSRFLFWPIRCGGARMKLTCPPRLWLALFIPIGATACVPSHQELLQRDRGECAQFGFQPGTDRHADCLLKLDAGRHHAGHRY